MSLYLEVGRMYVGQLCKFCARPIEEGDLEDLIFVGAPDYDEPMCAHGRCWRKSIEIVEGIKNDLRRD